MNITARYVVIVGCGSIGRRHLEHVRNFASKIIIVNPIFPDQVIDNVVEGQQIEWCAEIESVPTLNFNETDLGVISNWGPDHFDTFKKLIELGLTRIVLEKPMVCSIANLESMMKIVQEKRIHIVVNQGWHYIQLAERINKIAAIKELGSIAMINASGGARCISTAGSHVIHLAHQLLGKDFEKITGNFGDNDINPRNKELSYLDGTLTVNFSSNRYLNISYTNVSSIEGRIEIYWRDAIGILNEDEIEITTRDPFREYASKITRYGKENVCVFSGKLPIEEEMNTNQLDGLYKTLILEKFENLWYTFNLHCNSNRTLLFSLISNNRSRSLGFNDSLSREEIKMKFRIS